MLVLSRKPGERILIGEDVKITVIRVGPNSVRIGIDAPGNYNIVREELCVEQRDTNPESRLPEQVSELPRVHPR